MDNIDIYNNSAIIYKRKIPKSVLSWITILIILTILFIIISFIRFNIYNSFVGHVVKNDDSYIVRVSSAASNYTFDKSKKLYIKTKQYNYDVIKIDEENIYLKIDLDESIKIDNNILVLNILSNRTTIFDILKNKIKKGFGL